MNIKALEEKYGQKAYAGQWIHEGMAYFDASLHFEDKAEAERVTPHPFSPLLHASFLDRSVSSRQVAERAGQKAIYDLQQQRVVAIIPGHHPYYHLLSEADRNDATSTITN